MKTSYQKSSNPELSGICLDVLGISKQSTVPGIPENPLVIALETAHTPFHEVVLREANFKVGDRLSKLNRKRISMANSLKNLLRQLGKFSNTTRADAANAIMSEWNKLVNITARNDYDEVNTYMDKLLTLLKSDALKPHFTTLTLTDAIADVETAETEFRNLYNEQTYENAGLRLQGSATQHRPPVEKALGNYLKFVTAMRDQPGYDELYSTLKEAVRTARKAAKKEQPDTGETI